MFANFLNHMQPSDPTVDATNSQWGLLNGGGSFQVNQFAARKIEFGFRVRF